MGKVQVTGEDVVKLLLAATDRGTMPAAIRLAKEWIESAEGEVERLRPAIYRAVYHWEQDNAHRDRRRWTYDLARGMDLPIDRLFSLAREAAEAEKGGE